MAGGYKYSADFRISDASILLLLAKKDQNFESSEWTSGNLINE